MPVFVVRFVRRTNRLTVGVLLAAASGILLNSCGSPLAGSTTAPSNLIQPGLTPFSNSRQATSTACTANAHTAGRARWTVLMFINAASNLQDDSWFNVAQMAAVGSDADLNIVVQWKQASSNPFFSGIKPAASDTPSFSGTRRYLIHQHSGSELIQIAGGDTSSPYPDRLADPSPTILSSNEPPG